MRVGCKSSARFFFSAATSDDSVALARRAWLLRVTRSLFRGVLARVLLALRVSLNGAFEFLGETVV
jgi:hypothetical protein